MCPRENLHVVEKRKVSVLAGNGPDFPAMSLYPGHYTDLGLLQVVIRTFISFSAAVCPHV
jgi:hypothetical protein